MNWTAMWTIGLAGCLFGGKGDPPVGVSFDADPLEITEGEETELVLVVDDAQGTNSVVGVTIVDENSDMTLVELQESPDDEGTYRITVSWDDFADLEPLDFERLDTRPLEAVFEDKKGNLSEVMTLDDLDLVCLRQGGAAFDRQCFNIRTDSAVASSDCETICEERNFTCNRDEALEQFGEVGNASFQVDDNGQTLDVLLSMPSCRTQAAEVTFRVSNGDDVTITPESVIGWTCNCRP